MNSFFNIFVAICSIVNFFTIFKYRNSSHSFIVFLNLTKKAVHFLIVKILKICHYKNTYNVDQ